MRFITSAQRGCRKSQNFTQCEAKVFWIQYNKFQHMLYFLSKYIDKSIITHLLFYIIAKLITRYRIVLYPFFSPLAIFSAVGLKCYIEMARATVSVHQLVNWLTHFVGLPVFNILRLIKKMNTANFKTLWRNQEVEREPCENTHIGRKNIISYLKYWCKLQNILGSNYKY